MTNPVLLFTGHLIDPVDRVNERFPFGLVHEVQRTIQNELNKVLVGSPLVAISSLAAGGDMIFADEVLMRKIPLEVFLPFEQEKFLAASVKYVKGIPGEDPKEWESDFQRVLSQATVIHELKCSDDLAACYASCNQAMLTYALERANQVPDNVLALALMKNSDGLETGGTADFVNMITSKGIAIRQIWPA